MIAPVVPTGIALVRAPVAPLHAEPRVSSAQTSQALFGHTVWLFEARGDWYRVHTSHDDYEGWTHAGYLDVLDGAEMREIFAGAARDAEDFPGISFDWSAAPDAERGRYSLGCTVRAGGRTVRLPLGAWVFAEQTVLGGEVAAFRELPERFPPDGDAVVRTALRYFESTSYQWGGVTPWGADCSGLAQSVYALHGVSLPRDAWQQARAGTDAGTDLAAHQSGDLLFFSDRDDGRITHVGIAAGGGTMCHLALGRGGWAVDDLTDESDAYATRLRAQLVSARRVLG
jgi:hypothetical protein